MLRDFLRLYEQFFTSLVSQIRFDASAFQALAASALGSIDRCDYFGHGGRSANTADRKERRKGRASALPLSIEIRIAPCRTKCSACMKQDVSS
jgi:hypothetical protein